jgi:two-component system, chemotaxis family, chemotaxis protein CheY
VVKFGPVPVQPSWVLIVDDDPAIREALGEMLRDEGFSVATAEDGRAAMEWLREQRPASCAVLLDLMMPVMDGAHFLRAKQADAALRAIPVLVVTAAGTTFRFDRTPDVKDTIWKPIEVPRLLAAIESCLA